MQGCVPGAGDTVLSGHGPSSPLEPYTLTRNMNIIQICANNLSSAKTEPQGVLRV